MGFGAIGLLPLVGLAAIPLIIHILSRLRLQKAAFPSLLLLASVRRERFSWLRLKELLLLILRTLALLFLLLAASRPYVKFRLPGAGRAGDLVVLLDDSYSMSYGDRWQRAVGVTRSLLSGMATGQRARLFVASGGAEGGQSEWQKPMWALAWLDSLKPSHTGAVLEPAMRAAVAAAQGAQARVIVVTDLQERALPDTWKPPKDVKLVLLDVGSDRVDNAGIERAYTADRFPLAGRPVRIKADLANYGANEATRTAVLSFGQRREEKVVSIPAHGRLTVEFETAYTETAPGMARVELRSDSLAADDARWLAVTPLERVRTLIVQSAAVPARFLTDALGMDSTALFQLNVINVAEFGRVDARDYGLVVLTDAAALGRADWTRLGFLLQARGAALLMAGTAPADSEVGQGLVRFTGQRGLGHDPKSQADFGHVPSSGFVSVSELDSTHPAVELLRLKDFADARFFTHARFDPAGGRVLARLVDGDPLMFEAADGRLMVWAFAPVPEQTDLVYKAAFVPLLHRTMASLASLRLRSDYLVGDTIRMSVDGAGPVEVVTPELSYQVEPGTGKGRPEVVFTNTGVPGAYAVGRQPVAVNVLAAEGDLTRVTAKRLAELGYEVRPDAGTGGSDLTQTVLWLAALAFALEMLLLLL